MEPTQAGHVREDGRAAAYMLAASLLFALMSALAKYLSLRYHAIELVFFRNAIGLVMILPWVLTHPPRQQGGRPGLLLFRGLIGTIALYAYFFNVAHIGLGEAVTYNLSYPIHIALFSWLLFREKLEFQVWLAILTGFAGVVMIFQPGVDNMPVSQQVAGLFSGMCAAFAYMAIQRLRRHYDARVIVISFMGVGALLPLLSFGLWYLPWQGAWREALSAPFVWPQAADWIWMLLMGGLAAAGQMMLTLALGLAPASRIGALNYTQILFAMLLGIALGDPLPGWRPIAGIGLIVLGSLLVMRYMRRESA